MDLKSLQHYEDDIVQNLFKAFQESFDNHEKEKRCATLIQSQYKTYVICQQIKTLNNKAIIIQRIFRGFLGRRKVNIIKMEKQIEFKYKLVNIAATMVQKVWRGYISRKNKKDYYKRKRYIEQIEKQSKETMLQLNKEAYAKREAFDQSQELQFRQEFENITQNLHHLKSTTHIKGVYGGDTFGTNPRTTTFGKTMDEHLSIQSKKYFQKEY